MDGNLDNSTLPMLNGKIIAVPTIDSTLKKQGQAADAKAVGDALENKESVLLKEVTGSIITITSTVGLAEVTVPSGTYPVTVTSTGTTESDSAVITSATDKAYLKTYSGTTEFTSDAVMNVKYGNTENGANLIALLKTAQEVRDSLLIFNNVSVLSWVSDSTYADFPYKANISLSGVTADHVAEVVLGLTEATSGNYAPVSDTSNGIVSIYAKVNTVITIPTIKCIKGVS